jgi:hypothetical protein
VYVYLDPYADDVHGPDRAPHSDAVVELVDEQRDRGRFLERELERKDAILLNMTEAVKAIAPPLQEEAPQEPPGGPMTATEQLGRVVGPQLDIEGAQEPAEPGSWWRRIFGG